MPSFALFTIAGAAHLLVPCIWICSTSEAQAIRVERFGFKKDRDVDENQVPIVQSVFGKDRQKTVGLKKVVEHHNGGAFVTPFRLRVQNVDERMLEEMT